jgi:RNA polymerase sigma-70 factor (ECF subfamily)
LLTIAYRQFLDHAARQPAHVALFDQAAPSGDWRGLDPAMVAERSEEGRMLDLAVGELPEKLRSVIVLHYTGGLSLRETAAAIGISVGTAKSRLNTGLEQLRRRLS